MRILYRLVILPLKYIQFLLLRRTAITRRLELFASGIVMFFLTFNFLTINVSAGKSENQVKPPDVQEYITAFTPLNKYSDLELAPPEVPKEIIKPKVIPAIPKQVNLKIFSRPLPYGCGIMTTPYSSRHKAIDLAQYGGCQELADMSGIITQIGFTSGGCGYTIVIDHQNGWTSTYCHGSGVQYVKTGQKVSAGTPVQYMGMSGDATGVHLHYVIKLNGKEMNPAIYTNL